MLEIQKILRSRSDGLQILEQSPYFLTIKQHPQFEELYQFTYNQIESEKCNPVVREARGIILNRDDDWSVVAFPFRRFFNHGEQCADQIDWSSARVQEKIDGTLFIMYHYKSRWHVATKGSPDASGSVNDNPITFKELFWRSAEFWLKGLSKSGEFDKENTYLWELTSPYNRVVCDYTERGPIGWVYDLQGNKIWRDELEDQTGYGKDGSRITLIGVRNNKTFQEYPLDKWRGDVHYVVNEYPLTTLEEVIEASKALNPLKQEGFVIVDGNFNRIKVKSPSYVAIHHLREGSPKKRIIDLLKSNEGDEVLAYRLLDEFPHEKKLFEEFNAKLDNICFKLEKIYEELKDIETQKEYALAALKTDFPAALFAMRKGQIKTFREFFTKLPTEKLIKILDGDS